MPECRYDWTVAQCTQLHAQPFMDLVFQAQTVHRQYFNPNEVQLSTLLSIKTGRCPEDCKYCSQSGHNKTELQPEKLMSVEMVLAAARAAKADGASRFCMGAAWRSPPKKDMPALIEMVKRVKALGLETCLTAGMLSKDQAETLSESGLDYYNHNLDTSPEYYKEVITTRTYDERLATLSHVRDSGMNVCCGGILGMGESLQDRLALLCQLANLPTHPQSVPVNHLVPIPGTPLADVAPLDEFEFIRIIALARIMMPQSMVRLSAGREHMSDSMQALSFMAGANSIFYGDRLLTTDNPAEHADRQLFTRLGIEPAAASGSTRSPACPVAEVA